MYTKRERKLLSISRAAIDLKGFFIITNKGDIIDEPTLLVSLFTKVEIEYFLQLLKLNTLQTLIIEEGIVKENVVGIVGYPDQSIDLNFTPAGVITLIASSISFKSEEIIANEGNKVYEDIANSVNTIEVMANIISFYMNTRYEEVIQLPINEIFRRYAICQKSFPNQVEPLTKEDKANNE